MSDITKAQKVRLGLFLVFAGVVAAGIVLAKVGSSVFEHRDHYFVRMPGGVGGLTRGADVTFNGMVVGRVDRVSVDPVDVGNVVIDLSLEAATPIPEDTTATIAMQGITGIKRMELAGGTNKARRRDPGEYIPAATSLLDELTQRAEDIVKKIDQLTDNVGKLTSTENAARITATLDNAEKLTKGLTQLVEEVRPRIVATLAEAEKSAQSLSELSNNGNLLMADARTAMASLRQTAERFDRMVGKDVEPMIADARQTMQSINGLVSKADTFVGRAQVELRVVLDSVSDGVEKIGDLADILRADPSSLILGRDIEKRP